MGGRPFYNDDIQTIQEEARASILTLLAVLDHDCIVQGCTVSATCDTYSVSPGVVYMGGQLLRCQGASAVTLPAALAPWQHLGARRAHLPDGQYENLHSGAVRGSSHDSPVGLQLYPAGGLTMAHTLHNQVNEVGDVKWGQLVSANYDAAGLGLPGTVAWGWGLCNDQSGRLDSRGAFVAGYDSDRTEYAAVGKTGGKETVALTVDEMPSHSHPSNNLIVDSRGNGEAEFRAAYTASTSAKGRNIKIETAGGGTAHENRPPFYVLAARQWVSY